MALTITIPGAVEATIGATAPAILTVGVGTPGATGPAGPGVPSGGSTGQVLKKSSASDYATEWATDTNTGVWGQISGTLSAQTDLSTALAGKYSTSNPAGYIDLTTAGLYFYPLTGNPGGYATQAWVTGQNYITISALSPYVLQTQLDYQLAGYALQSWVTDHAYPLTGNPSGFLTTASLSGYAPLASPVFTGDPQGPTAALGDSDTSLATTAFVQQELASGTAIAKNIEVQVRNQSGSTIAAGSIVYISGATGNRPLITLAQANNDANSAQTMGFVKTTIADNGTGYVIVRGQLDGIDTSALTEGVQLYLSPTTAGTWTTTKPSAPQHLVYVGIVIRSHPTLGTILVAVQNGYELNEIHDVAISSITDNDLLAYNASTGLWNNESFSTLGLLTSASASSTYAPIASPTFTGTVTIPAGASISGYATTASLGSYAPLAGATFTGKVNTVATSATVAGFNLPHGTAPSSPVDGDIWTTTGGIYARVNASTLTLLYNSYSGVAVSLGTSTATSSHNLFSGATISGATKAVNFCTGGVSGSTTTLAIGSTSGTTTTFNGTVNFTSGSLTLGNSTGAATYNLGSGATLTATTKAVNIGTNGVAGSTTNITIGSSTGTNAITVYGPTTFNGTTSGTTAAVDTNTTQLATTAYVIGQGYLKSATASSTYAPLASPTLTGVPLSTTAAVDTNTTQIATTAFVIGQGYLKSATATSTYAPLASPTFTGVPLSTTAAVDTNTTQIATTAYVIGQGYLKTSTASSTYAALASPTFTGVPLSTTAAADTNTTQIATTAFVVGQASSSTPLMDNGTAVIGTSLKYARADHVHPSDTSRAALAGATFTGKVNTVLSATTGAGLNLPHGAAPTTPTNGDVWTTTSGVFAQVNAATQQLAKVDSQTFTGTPTLPSGTIATTQTAGNSTTAIATTAFVTTADNLKANLASPTFTGTPLSTTAAADTNTTQIATTAYVVGQAGSATPLINGTAAVGTSLKYARQDHVHPTDTSRAPLASPTFTGTPLSTTASAGDYTTQIATTEYAMKATLDPCMHKVVNDDWSASTSGTGASTSQNADMKQIFGPTAIGYARMSQGLNMSSPGAVIEDSIDWSKKVYFSGRVLFRRGTTANLIYRVNLGDNFNSGDPVQRCVALKCTPNSTALQLQVHNGTTLTTVNSSFTPTIGLTFDFLIVSNAGTVTLYVNRSQVATTTAGPTNRAGSYYYNAMTICCENTDGTNGYAEMSLVNQSAYFTP